MSSAISHENIVQLLDVFAEGDSELVIVWELIDGPDLLDLLNECGGRMSEGAAVRGGGVMEGRRGRGERRGEEGKGRMWGENEGRGSGKSEKED